MEPALIAIGIQNVAQQGAPHWLELGAVRVVSGEIIDTFDSLICPPVEIESEATAWHGISLPDIRQAPHGPEVLAQFQSWLADSEHPATWLATHDAEAAATTLAFEFARSGKQAPKLPILDTLVLAQELIPECQGHSLEELCEHLDFEQGDQRRGLADAVWSSLVLSECLDRVQCADDETEPPVSTHGADNGLAHLHARQNRPLNLFERMPSPPAGNREVRKLERALASGTPVGLAYGERGQRRVPIKVQPQFLFTRGGREYMEGLCQSSGLLKTYRIDRIQRVGRVDQDLVGFGRR